MKINPLPIKGPWNAGFTLDQHTVSAEFLGYDQNGRPIFDTVRSEVGELLYQSKYRGNREACRTLATVAADFVRDRSIKADVVVPVPPSRTRAFQPLADIASRVANELGIEYDGTSLKKVKETPELKGVEDLAERATALRDAFGVEGNALRGKVVLLFDDLYRSGASMSSAARSLRTQGAVASVIALALTRTRSRT